MEALNAPTETLDQSTDQDQEHQPLPTEATSTSVPAQRRSQRDRTSKRRSIQDVVDDLHHTKSRNPKTSNNSAKDTNTGQSILRRLLQPSSLCKSKDLSKPTVDDIYKRSRSILNFATNLMLHLFDKSELRNCPYVYEPLAKMVKKQPQIKKSLDQNRVNIIRELVQERVGPNPQIWKKCVNSMYKVLYRYDKNAERDER